MPEINYTQIEQRTFEQVKDTFVKQGAHNPNSVTREATFESLGMDSLDEVETVMHVEEKFGIEIPEEDAKKFTTVGDVVKYVAATLAGQI